MKPSSKISYNKSKLQNKNSKINKPMSTSSKIIENHIQSAKNNKSSPKKVLPLPSSPQLTPRSRKLSNSQDDETMDKQELLLLEIRQMKRENNFLKKKIQDLLAELNGDGPTKKKKNNKGAIKQNIDSVHLSIDFFFQEINNLMNTLVNLFRVEFTPEQVEAFSNKYPEQEDILEPTKKYMNFKKFTLNRKLEKIILQKQQKRYINLLDVFMDYYRIKEENEKHVTKVVDSMTSKAIDLNKIIVQKVQQRQTLRSSGIRSVNNDKQEMSHLKLPWKFNRVGSPQSVISQNANKKRRTPVKDHKK